MNVEKYYMFKHKLGENQIVRYLYLPIIFIKELWISNTLYSNSDKSKMKYWKGKYNGKRCFIIGNGPSLSTEDLKLLNNEYTFASNRIYNIFSETDWRPNFYVCIDPIQLAENKNEISEMIDIVKFISCRKKMKDDKIFYINDKRTYIVNPNKKYRVNFSDDIAKKVYSHSTVLYVALQIAIYMGFTEIILLGVDHNFKVMTNSENKIIVNDKIKKNHFKNQQESDSNIVFDANGANNDYYATKKYAEKNNIKIYNATRGGCLEIFERRTLEEVLSGCNK